MSLLVETFYLFFEGIMLFQVLYFGMIFLLSRRKDVLFYSLLNLISAAYFFLNAPDTFLRINEDIVFNSVYYSYINYALILLMALMYLLFLKEIFSESVIESRLLRRIYQLTMGFIPVLYILFAWFEYKDWNTDLIFYMGYFVNGPFCTWILMKNRAVKGYRFFIILGMFIIFLCVSITLWFTIRYNEGRRDYILDYYPLMAIKTGMLIDVILFQLVLTQRWQNQEKELAIQQLQSELALAKMRNQISQELHDDIGSTLSGIHMYSHLAQKQAETGEKENTNKSLSIIQVASGDMINRLKDMVWTIQPGHDTLKELLEKIQEYAVFMAGSKHMEVDVTIPEVANTFKIITECRHHIFMIAKEIINNAVKYSGGSRLSVVSEVKHNDFFLTIKDNGSGFNQVETKKGNGILNIKKRAEEISATLELNTNLDHGTEWRLMVKITR